MNVLGEAIGKACEIILPIPEESFPGNPDSRLAVCTLSSMSLLKSLARSDAMNRISIAGRLLSENKGIDSILKHLDCHPRITTLLVCGKDVWGHRAGHSLSELHRNGTDGDGRIIDSTSPDPYVTVPKHMIEHFQNNVILTDMIGQTDLKRILEEIYRI